MSDHREDLGRLRLTELFIPGTHDSAAYSVTYQPREESRYDKYVFTQSKMKVNQEEEASICTQTVVNRHKLRCMGQIKKRGETTIIKRVYLWKPKRGRPLSRPRIRWSDQVAKDMCRLYYRLSMGQSKMKEESVLSQLVNGVRYLDLRLGYHKNDGGFFSHHGFAKLRHFQGVIDDLVVFLENSKDIVIIDLHHFPVGFKSEENHKELVRYLEKELSEYMATPALGWRATLEDVWKTGKQLIVSYNNKAIVSKGTHKLWYPVSQRWGDVRTVEGLREYLRSVMRRQPLEAWAAMAELTPDKWAVLLDTQGGLRAMAARTNMQVTDWFRHDWALYCNIVAVDFVRSSGIINIAIDSNLRSRILGFRYLSKYSCVKVLSIRDPRYLSKYSCIQGRIYKFGAPRPTDQRAPPPQRTLITLT
ncbi:hypothetical protein J6590_029154 [Homalodisca vitripennis]|nr:hypothetical protein J6590_029154 [Homalodisca vitripennis]